MSWVRTFTTDALGTTPGDFTRRTAPGGSEPHLRTADQGSTRVLQAEYPNASRTGGDVSSLTVYSWDTPGILADTRVLATIHNTTAILSGNPQQQSFMLGARWDGIGAYYLIIRPDESAARLYWQDRVIGVPIAVPITASVSVPDGTYFVRFTVEDEESGSRVRARLWDTTAEEPEAWLIDYLHTSADRPLEGRPVLGVGQFNGSGFVSPSPLVWWERLSVNESPPEPEPLPELVRVPDRLRCSITADSGSILASTRAVPFDASHSIAFNLLRRLPQVEPVGLREVTRAQDDPTADVSFLPRATQNSQSEHTYDGVTVLTLMARAYPAPIVARWDDPLVDLPDNLASSWLSWVFARWQTEFPWFDYEPVPDLRLAIPGSTGIALPSEYAPTIPVDRPRLAGGITSDILRFTQERESRVSMLEMLEQMLSPFPGVVYYQTSEGRLRLVPAYGPDADEAPTVELAEDFVVDVTAGEPDALNTINRATVRSTGYALADDVPVMQPAWYQVGPTAQYGSGNWYDPPGDRLNLQPHPSGNVLQEELPPGAAFFNQSNMVWPSSPTVSVAGASVRLFSGTDPLVTCAWKLVRRSDDAVVESGTTGLNLFASDLLVPLDGAEVLAFQWLLTVSGTTLQVNSRMRWDAATQSVRVRLTGSFLTATISGAPHDMIVEFALNDESTAYVETPGATVSFGVVDNGDTVPTPGGGNAVADSQAAFGVVEETIDVRGYVLSPDQALGVAESFVLANLSPRATRDVTLGWLGSTQVLFDHRGRRVLLPDGGVGRITGVTYADDFVSVTGGKGARVEVEIDGAPGQVGTDAVLLLNHDGSFWQNHDFTTSEVP